MVKTLEKKLICIKELDLNNENLMKIEEFSIKINKDKNFLNNFLNDDLTFCLVENNLLKSVIKLSYKDNNLNNKYLTDFNDEINEEYEPNYNDYLVTFFHSDNEQNEFLTVLYLGKKLQNCNVELQ